MGLTVKVSGVSTELTAMAPEVGAEDPVPRGRWHLAWLVLALVALFATIVVMVAGRSLTFFFDEWTWITDRRDMSINTLLVPHNEHLSLVPVSMYWTLFHTVGLTYWPYRLMIVLANVAVAALTFSYLRMRVPWGLACCGAALILFFGAAYQVLLWPFEASFALTMIGILGLLLLLDRRTKGADIGAAALAVFALASSGLGLPLLGAVGLELVLRRRWRRLWVVLAPLSLYALWYLRYGTRTGSSAGFFGTIRWTIEFAGSSVGGILVMGEAVGLILLLPLLALTVWGFRRADRDRRPRVIALAAMPIAYWAIVGLGRSGVQEPGTSRYLYAGGVLTILLVGECCAGVRMTRIAVGVIAVVTAFAVTMGTVELFRNGDELRSFTRQTLATVSAVDIGTRTIDPSYAANRDAPPLDGRPIVAAFDALGSIALTPEQVRSLAEENRQQADGFLVAAVGMQPIAPTTPSGPPPVVVSGDAGSREGASCLRFDETIEGVDVELVPQTGFLLVDAAGGSPVEIWIRSFADGYFGAGSPYVSVAGGTAVDIPTPSTAAPVWHLRLASTAPVIVCGAQ